MDMDANKYTKMQPEDHVASNPAAGSSELIIMLACADIQ